MTAPREWVLASGNDGKRVELERLLAPAGWRLRSQAEFGVAGAPETAATFIENALAKARHVATRTGRPALADDSGLAVDVLGGAPGVHSARYAGPGASDAVNVARLLDALGGVEASQRSAHFVCVLVALRAADDPDPLIGRATWPGHIAASPRGDGGFGYDPVFVPVGEHCTAAQLSANDKARLSHRGRAVAALLEAVAGARR